MSNFRSNLEQTVSKILGSHWKYEQWRIPYIQERTYLPDFSKGLMHIEVKGRFKPGEQAKYLAVRKCLPKGEELIFVFSNPNKKVRKNSKLTMGEWATLKGFRYYSVNFLPKGGKS